MDKTWILPLKDGTNIVVPFDRITAINEKLRNREAIVAANRTILYQDIAGGIRESNPDAAADELLEDASRALGEPVILDDGSVKCAWVRKDVPIDRWNKYHSQFNAYRKLMADSTRVVLAYRLPVHMLTDDVQKCTPNEVLTLERKLST